MFFLRSGRLEMETKKKQKRRPNKIWRNKDFVSIPERQYQLISRIEYIGTFNPGFGYCRESGSVATECSREQFWGFEIGEDVDDKAEAKCRCHGVRTKVKNSSRVFGSSRKAPSIAEVTVLALIFCTPRITMHMCLSHQLIPSFKKRI